jgi:hypothetical protein
MSLTAAAKITLEAEERRRADVTPCCQGQRHDGPHPDRESGDLGRRAPAPFGRFATAVARSRAPLGVPERGDCTDDVLYAPMAAELPPRVATPLRAVAGCPLPLWRAGASVSPAEDLRTWQAECATRSQKRWGRGWQGDGDSSGGWRALWRSRPYGRTLQPPQVAMILVRRLAPRRRPWRDLPAALSACCPAEALAVVVNRPSMRRAGVRRSRACKHVMQRRFTRAGMR